MASEHRLWAQPYHQLASSVTLAKLLKLPYLQNRDYGVFIEMRYVK